MAFAFEIPQAYNFLLLSSSDIVTATRDTVYTGGTASADLVFNGLYLGSLSYAGGTAGISLTLGASITNLNR